MWFCLVFIFRTYTRRDVRQGIVPGVRVWRVNLSVAVQILCCEYVCVEGDGWSDLCEERSFVVAGLGDWQGSLGWYV